LIIGGRMLAAITAAIQTRVELLATEMAAERARLGWLLLIALAFAVAVLLGMAFTSFLVIAYFWDDHRLIAIGGVAGFYWLVALLFALALKRWIDRRKRPFSGTLETLRRDYTALLGSIGITPMQHDSLADGNDLPRQDPS
jgi:uncharacterized membrane protein YqjE